KLAEEKALAGDLQVQNFRLSYAKAKDLEPTVKRVALSARGPIITDERTKPMIVTELALNLEKTKNLIADLDRATPQVEIEARIVVTSRTFLQQYGIQWGFLNQQTPQFANTTGLAFPNAFVVNGAPIGNGTGGLPATQNNQAAEIKQGVQIPIQTIANNTVTVIFKDAVLTLKVTPQITEAGTVILTLEVENNSPDFSRQIGTGATAVPPINTQSAKTI